VGALLEQPGTGKILAMYGGPNYSAKNCARILCSYNMATQSRNLVGSSFKPYVLATAVKEGMDVQDSELNAIEPMCVPPDSMPSTFSTQTTNCPPSWFPVNILGENVGHGISVADAAAQSSDPAFEDLVHRAGTQATINMAKAFGVNVFGALKVTRRFIKPMIEKRRGSIINMASVASSIKGVPQRFAYSATKAAVIGLTKSIAADFVARGVRCNAICPGTVKTPSLDERVAALGGDPDAAWRSFVQRQPMGRLGEPQEIAALALYLASDESAFTTGQIHIVDGGWSN